MHNFATKLLIVLGCFVVLFCKLTLAAVQKVSGSSLIDLPLPASEYESLRHSIYVRQFKPVHTSDFADTPKK